MFDVLTIGTATRDTFLSSAGIRVLRDPKHLAKLGFPTGEAECFALGAKIEVTEPVVSVGGGAANAAVTFARQGFRTAALVRIGADASGRAIVDVLKGEGVQVLAVRDGKLGTAASTILLTPDGERTILVYRGASEKLARREVPLLSARGRSSSGGKLAARWAYVAPGGIAFSVMLGILSTLKRRGTMIALNPSREYLMLGKSTLRRLLVMADVIIVNREEASELTGVDYRSGQKVFRAFTNIVSGIAVMTDGPNGATVSDCSHRYTAGIFKEHVRADRTGAGDAFGSGFVAGLMTKQDIPYALRMASANATAVVERVGAEAGILTAQQFRDPRWRYLHVDMELLD